VSIIGENQTPPPPPPTSIAPTMIIFVESVFSSRMPREMIGQIHYVKQQLPWFRAKRRDVLPRGPCD
jgi:hypothetical protein